LVEVLMIGKRPALAPQWRQSRAQGWRAPHGMQIISRVA
jgi:hypothetical protein